jgi:hypothetical protein
LPDASNTGSRVALGALMASNTYFFSQKSTFGSCFVTSK